MKHKLSIALLAAVFIAEPAAAQINRTDGRGGNAVRTCCTATSYMATGSGMLVARDISNGKDLHLMLGSATSKGASGSVRSSAAGFNTTEFRRGQVVHTDAAGRLAFTTRFPIELRQADEMGASSRTMETHIVLSSDGTLRAQTRIATTDSLTGFTGAVEIGLADISGNVLHRVPKRTYGVSGTHVPGSDGEKVVAWDVSIPAQALDRVAMLIIEHHRDAKDFFPAATSWISNNSHCVLEAWKYADSGPQGNKRYVKAHTVRQTTSTKLLRGCQDLLR